MTADALTVSQTITEINDALRDYIEATYHVGHPALVRRRRELLERPGVISKEPYFESTPRYQAGTPFEELRINSAATELLQRLSTAQGESAALLHNPPYTHQARALEASHDGGTSLVVTTGTGSGKTETFMLPMLAKLAAEASQSPESFAIPAMRAMVLYPMNALVNDQLGRLRLLLGDSRVSQQFTRWAGRPARFARYTGRTLYPGVRDSAKDPKRLKSIRDFYIRHLRDQADGSAADRERADALISNLRSRGKWPAKPDLEGWYGQDKGRWKDSAGNFIRAVMRNEDPELITRHEVLDNPPDVLITNYSMLEYMLMRPLERPIFDMTRQWLANNPDEKFMLIVDEAHLYRGAAGAEVGLLLRRLRARLGITADRVQVICTSASFDSVEYARAFAADLTGKDVDDFLGVEGDLLLQEGAESGSVADAEALDVVSMKDFYDRPDENGERVDVASSFLAYRGAPTTGESVAEPMYDALKEFGPMKLLINETMKIAQPLSALAPKIFPDADHALGERALTALIAFGSIARQSGSSAGLLPCRVHAFFRGLPGLWACLDEKCPVATTPEEPAAPTGKLYAQPRDECDCGARVFELYTCRNCGCAYARAYTDDIDEPRFLWNEPGQAFSSRGAPVDALYALDVLLEEPSDHGEVQAVQIDLETGRLDPDVLGPRTRTAYLRTERTSQVHVPGDDEGDDNGATVDAGGRFVICGACKQGQGFQRSAVQDHQTSGDQPFQALITRQIEVQPPGPAAATLFAPLRGRKVLAFSDSRQTAARLSPNLKEYSLRDVLRPSILRGWQELLGTPYGSRLSLDDLGLAALVGANALSVRLRPEPDEHKSILEFEEATQLVRTGVLDDLGDIFDVVNLIRVGSPESFLLNISSTMSSKYLGFGSLGLASVRETAKSTLIITSLPDLPGVADNEADKLALIRQWLAFWAASRAGVHYSSSPAGWADTSQGASASTGKFTKFQKWLGPNKSAFEKLWLKPLVQHFGAPAADKYRLRADRLALDLLGDWQYCDRCRSTQRPFKESKKCITCGHERLMDIDPDTDSVFIARKGYYRNSSVSALSGGDATLMSLVAAEHTAQLNSAQPDDVFSKSEEYELLFQDVDLGTADASDQSPTAVDVLSCTTTMEVGIDIGNLSGVALRNMPPARSNYQQRAGRAGRRGNAIATVIAFGSADSHDEHYFNRPELMISGRPTDPKLTLDNIEIVRRHVAAFLLQRYHQDRLPAVASSEQPKLFEVLGTVADFNDPTKDLNESDFASWLADRNDALVQDVADWLPTQLPAADREGLLGDLAKVSVRKIRAVLDDATEVGDPDAADDAIEDLVPVDMGLTNGEFDDDAPRPRGAQYLLTRLLEEGVLPRYAFPTDVVAFHIFDGVKSTKYRTVDQYTPSQGLTVALSQYAPGKQIWVDNKQWFSGALYSPQREARYQAWQDRKYYFECNVCRFAQHVDRAEAVKGERRQCPACRTDDSFGGAKYWVRPPGFAHPVEMLPGTSPDEAPARSFATRAKLVAGGTTGHRRNQVGHALHDSYSRSKLLVTNTGPDGKGYSYCTLCGLIEPSSNHESAVMSPHRKPFPAPGDMHCDGRGSKGIVLGTDFQSDVLLIGARLDAPLRLLPGELATEVVLRTVAEALTIAATRLLDIDATELQAEYRPALTAGGQDGSEVELYMYDTLAGGAGFARRAGDLGRALYETALEILTDCPEGCDRSCYRCLRRFGNRFEHQLLDRHVGAALLSYLLDGTRPEVSAEKLAGSADRLFADLTRQGLSGVSFRRLDPAGGASVDAPPILIEATVEGHVHPIALHGPLTPPDTDQPSSVPNLIWVNQLVVAHNLPRASSDILKAIGVE